MLLPWLAYPSLNRSTRARVAAIRLIFLMACGRLALESPPNTPMCAFPAKDPRARLSLLESGERFGGELEHERHRDELFLGYDLAVLGEKLDQRAPAQPGRAMHLWIATKQLVHRILHVVALNAVGVQDTSACVGILRQRRSGVALRDRRDPAARPGRAHGGVRRRDSAAIPANSKECCVGAPLPACARDV